jgi:hypothetical protein
MSSGEKRSLSPTAAEGLRVDQRIGVATVNGVNARRVEHLPFAKSAVDLSSALLPWNVKPLLRDLNKPPQNTCNPPDLRASKSGRQRLAVKAAAVEENR